MTEVHLAMAIVEELDKANAALIKERDELKTKVGDLTAAVAKAQEEMRERCAKVINEANIVGHNGAVHEALEKAVAAIRALPLPAPPDDREKRLRELLETLPHEAAMLGLPHDAKLCLRCKFDAILGAK